MSEDDEYLVMSQIHKLKIDNICENIIKVVCENFPEDERFLVLGRVTNILIQKIYMPIVKIIPKEEIKESEK